MIDFKSDFEAVLAIPPVPGCPVCEQALTIIQEDVKTCMAFLAFLALPDPIAQLQTIFHLLIDVHAKGYESGQKDAAAAPGVAELERMFKEEGR